MGVARDVDGFVELDEAGLGVGGVAGADVEDDGGFFDFGELFIDGAEEIAGGHLGL